MNQPAIGKNGGTVMLSIMKCTFCGKKQGIVRAAAATRRSVCICEECLNICRTILAKATKEEVPVTEPRTTYRISSSNSDPSARRCCSFCDTPMEIVHKLIGSPRGKTPAYICDKCVAARTFGENVRKTESPKNFWHWIARKIGIHNSHLRHAH